MAARETLIAILVGILLLGGVALPAALVLAVLERRRWGTIWRSSVLGFGLLVLLIAFLAWGTVRGCGPNCVVDPGPFTAVGIWNLLVWELGVLGVWSWTRRDARESGSQ